MAPTLPDAFRAAASDLLTEDPAELETYGRDWTRLIPPAPSAVAFPRSTGDVSRLLALATQHQVAVVPSGGRTGLSGGAVAARGELVVSLERMRRLQPVDLAGSTVRVQAGAVTQAVHTHAAEVGLTWPVDFASKGSSTVGGNIATNAGGVRVIRYGLTRQWVMGLEVVLASGTVLQIGGALEKDNTGLDLRQLFIGSEGTLGIVTEATLKLCRPPERTDVLLFGVKDLAAVLALFREVRQSPFTIQAFELFSDRCLARVERHRHLRAPLEKPAPFYVLCEIEQASEIELDRFLVELFERGLAVDGTKAANRAQAADLWALREGISESLSATGFPYKNDIALPIAALEAFCADLEALLARDYPGFELCLFGHVGDGNLHVNVMQPEGISREAFLAKVQTVDQELFTLVQSHRGSISAEHGIGLLKKPYLAYSRSPEEIATMKAVKRALDPLGILNPGKIFDL